MGSPRGRREGELRRAGLGRPARGWWRGRRGRGGCGASWLGCAAGVRSAPGKKRFWFPLTLLIPALGLIFFSLSEIVTFSTVHGRLGRGGPEERELRSFRWDGFFAGPGFCCWLAADRLILDGSSNSKDHTAKLVMSLCTLDTSYVDFSFLFFGNANFQ